MHARRRVGIGLAARGALLASGWLLGVALQLRQPALWPWDATAVVTAVALLAGALAWRRRDRFLAVLALTLCAATLGFTTTASRAAWRLSEALQPALEGLDITLTGTVAEMPRLGEQGTRFVFETDGAELRGHPVRVPPRITLGWYRSADDDSLLALPAEDIRAGQRWRLPVRLRAPHGTLNPDGFDLELWLFEQGIAASGSVRSKPQAPAVKLAETVAHPVERLRQALRDAIVARVPDPAAAGVLAALVIGDQAAIDREAWDVFRITGVAHLMSISGLHVTMFAWLAGALVGRLWRLHPRLLLAFPASIAALWCGWAAAAGYALLAGWGVPAQRTVWMIGCVVLLRSQGARWPLHAVLLLAAWVVTVLDPWALMQPGFWLSYGAVALLVASEPAHALPRTRAIGLWPRVWQTTKDGMRTQTVATIGLAPLSLVYFQQISLVGFAANLLAIPLVTLLITPLALLGVLLPPLWLLAAWLVKGLSVTLQALAGLPLAQWSAAAAPAWSIACGLLAAVLAVLPLPWRLRALAVPLALPLLAPPVARPEHGRFELVAADIGQGTAVLLRTQAHLLLFDTGPQTSPGVDAGSRVLVPLLRARGERRVDTLMLSHRDIDHVGGAAAVLAAFPVGLLSSSLIDVHPLVADAARRGVPHRRCEAGQRWNWDGVTFEVLHPVASDHALRLKPNALSCVLHVQGPHGSVLLAGDVEAQQEAALLQRSPSALRSDVLMVPHHGSRTSSTAAFIDAVAPHAAVVQAAYRSRFGHPAPDVVARYQERGVAVVRSDRCGAWTLPAHGAPLCQREAARRYWHHRVAGADDAAP